MLATLLFLALPPSLLMSYGEASAQDMTLTASKADQAPVLDGKADDACWAKAKDLKVEVADAMDPSKGKKTVTLKAVRVGDEIHVLMSWPDESESALHKPWVWDKAKGEYLEGSDIEDCGIVAFPLEGEFNPNMRAGVESSWDVWHWKAARTNPAGYAQDKRHVYMLKKPEFKAAMYKTVNGDNVWITRPEDEGTSTTKKAAKPAKEGEKVVTQHVAVKPDGSTADVRAKGAWKDGVWTLELSRKLNTGHKDDAVLEAGKAIAFAVAVLDASEEEHSASAKLTLKIE
jgi:hypothetical protein